jgi:cyclopropane fatty-acyl-phospholipid synthase-like methyltransferase
MKFIEQEIFPAAVCRRRTSKSWLPTQVSRSSASTCCSRTTRARSTCGPRTWRRTDAALAMQGQEVHDRYMHYLTGCADFFHRGVTNVGQFTLQK